MFVSAARKKLNAAIEGATCPAEIALLTTALSRLIDAEGRAKGRRQRQKALRERSEEATARGGPRRRILLRRAVRLRGSRDPAESDQRGGFACPNRLQN